VARMASGRLFLKRGAALENAFSPLQASNSTPPVGYDM